MREVPSECSRSTTRLYSGGVAEEVIAATPGFESVGEAESGEEGIAAVERLHPQLVLLDVRMPGIGGIETARRITTAHPERSWC